MSRRASGSLPFSQQTILLFAGLVILSSIASAQTTRLQPTWEAIYLGADVDPKGEGESVRAVRELEGAMNRTLALDVHHYQWAELGEQFPTALEEDDLARGRIPVISWNCGVPNAVVASGAVDSTITAAARAIQAYGNPVLLRYMPEMNLQDTSTNRTACHGPSDNPNGNFSAQDFIAAWDHIRKVFDCPNLFGPCQPVTNAVWLWNPGRSGASFVDYYPGDNEVDWLGINALDKDQPNPTFSPETPANQFFQTVNPVYGELNSLSASKPILLETAALHGNQAAYLNFDAPVRLLQSSFPAIKGMIYHDVKGSDFDWSLDDQGGFCAFIILGLDPYMLMTESGPEQGTPPPNCCTCMLPGH